MSKSSGHLAVKGLKIVPSPLTSKQKTILQLWNQKKQTPIIRDDSENNDSECIEILLDSNDEQTKQTKSPQKRVLAEIQNIPTPTTQATNSDEDDDLLQNLTTQAFKTTKTTRSVSPTEHFYPIDDQDDNNFVSNSTRTIKI